WPLSTSLSMRKVCARGAMAYGRVSGDYWKTSRGSSAKARLRWLSKHLNWWTLLMKFRDVQTECELCLTDQDLQDH
ncbi:hypothetical protein M513_13324, partial [Trichuris suis]